MLDKYLGIAQGYALKLTLEYSQSENNHRLLHMLHNSCAMLPEYSRPAHHPYKRLSSLYSVFRVLVEC